MGDSNFSLSEIYTKLPDEVNRYVTQKKKEALLRDSERAWDLYLQRFIDITERKDETERNRGIEAFKKWAVDTFVTNYEDVPENYWKLQVRVLREAGRLGDWDSLSDEDKEKEKRGQFELLEKDQASSLLEWISYFASDESKDISPKMKYWVLRNVIGLQEFDKERHIFPKRSKGTLKMFPELDRQLLRRVNEMIQGKTLQVGDPEIGYDVTSIELSALNTNARLKRFAEVYGTLIDKIRPLNEDLLKITDGEWIIFEQGGTNKSLHRQ